MMTMSHKNIILILHNKVKRFSYTEKGFTEIFSSQLQVILPSATD